MKKVSHARGFFIDKFEFIGMLLLLLLLSFNSEGK